MKDELDCFNCKAGDFSDYSLQCLQKKAITIHDFAKKFSSSMGTLNNYKENLSVPRVRNAALIES